MSIRKGVEQGFTGVVELPNVCRHVQQRVKEDKYEQVQVIGDELGVTAAVTALNYTLM